MNCGDKLPGRPSMGSWLTYGLGTREPEPARLRRAVSRAIPSSARSLWNSTFLPGVYQGTYIPNNEMTPRSWSSTSATPELKRARPAPPAGSARPSLNRLQLQREGPDPQLEASIQSAEIAFRMQTEAPDVFDIRKEPRSHAGPLRRRRFRARLPAGAASGRARRPHGAGLLRQRPALGQPRRHPDPPQAGRAGAISPSRRCSKI